MRHLKEAAARGQAPDDDTRVPADVRRLLAEIDAGGEAAVRDIARRFDRYEGDVRVGDARRAALIASVPEAVKDDIRFAHRQVLRFAEAQRRSIAEFEIETEPGVRLAQRVIPVDCAGCYVPGGRYAHAASAIMSIATAKAAGVPRIVAASPPRDGSIDPTVVFAMDLAGADAILELGGVQAIAALAFGLFSGREADIVVGPGNAHVAEAKRQLFGRIGIDVIAGPTESAIIADGSADPMTLAVDLVSQAEHGPTSPVWLFTTSEAIGREVMRLVPLVAAELPTGETALRAWNDCAEVLLCDDPEEVVRISDRYAPEHLQVICVDTDWYAQRLRCYGSLFLGEGSTVTHGDKCSGTNHILPTGRAGRYSGGLNVHKFLKVLTSQRIDAAANERFSAAGSRISRIEGMEGHARACDWRLRKYFPDREWPFEVYAQKRL